MIKVSELYAGYGHEIKLKNINCSFVEKEITVIVGKNGSGKSTLLKAIAGLIKPMQGNIFLDIEDYIEDISKLSNQMRARQISYLPQNRNIPVISAERMVLHGRFPYLEYPRRYKKEDYEIVANAMERVGILYARHHEMAQLSGGERQKVYIAMALAQDTHAILLDEPTTFLDITYQLEMLHLMRQLKQQGKTVITVMHDLNAALQLADQIIVMNQGHIEEADVPEKIVQSGIIEKVLGVKVKTHCDENMTLHYYFEHIS